jgi:O-methyltransferase involved in polyketide biosynthesis
LAAEEVDKEPFMDVLSDVSETALITLRARAIETKKEEPLIRDDAGVELLDRIGPLLPADTRQRIMDRKLSPTLTRYIALRARKYDSYARSFISENADGLVVSLGCGFDTRYWRVSEEPWNYVEIDLPEVIAAKKKVLADVEPHPMRPHPMRPYPMGPYPMIGCSVLEERWVEEIRSMQDEDVLFLAEGLFVYFPKPEVVRVFDRLSESFSRSHIVFEVANERYTKGIWKKLVESKMRRSSGTGAGSSYQFGVRDAKDVEAYGQHIKVVEEWSYYEAKDIRPRVLALFRNFKLMSRTQWTVRATIG